MHRIKEIYQVDKIITSVLKESLKTKKKSAIILITTVHNVNSKIVIAPIRRTPYAICASLIIHDLKTAVYIVKKYDGKVNFIFIDAEQKIKGLEKLCSYIDKKVLKSQLFTFKTNDFTADSTDMILDQLLKNKSKKKIAIIGAGNLGSKVALKLAERGNDVFITRSNLSKARKTAIALNFLKTNNSSGRIHAASKSKVAKDCDALIGFSSSVPVITSSMVMQMKKTGVVVDGGLGTIQPQAIRLAQKREIPIKRIDVRASISGIVTSLLETKHLLEKVMGSLIYKNVRIISGGVYGKYGDIVIDDVSKPTQILGIADGMGKLLPSSDVKNFDDRIKIVKSWLSTNSPSKYS